MTSSGEDHDADPLGGEPLFRFNLSKIGALLSYIGLCVLTLFLCNWDKTANDGKNILEYIVGGLFLGRLAASVFVYDIRKESSCSFLGRYTISFRSCFTTSESTALASSYTADYQPTSSTNQDDDENDDQQQRSATSNNNNNQSQEQHSTSGETREETHYLSNIKILVILIVVLAHSALFLSGYFLGAYKSSASSIFSFLLFIFGPSAMPLLFFISAYFVPNSLHKSKRRQFLNKKSIRLTIALLLSYLIFEPSWVYISQRTVYPEIMHEFAPYEYRFGSKWFIFELLLYTYAYVFVSEAWPCHDYRNRQQQQQHQNSNNNTTEYDHVVTSEKEESISVSASIVGDEEQNDVGDKTPENDTENGTSMSTTNEKQQEETKSSTKENFNSIPLIKMTLYAFAVGALEGVRIVVATGFFSSQGNVFVNIFYFILGLIARRDQWLSSTNGGILTQGQRRITTMGTFLSVLLVVLFFLLDLRNDWNFLVPFKTKCDEELIGASNPIVRLSKDDIFSGRFFGICGLYAFLCAYSICFSFAVLDVTRRRMNYTNRFLKFLGDASYGVYLVHLMLSAVFMYVYVEILIERGVIEAIIFLPANNGLSSTCLGGDGYIWLGVLFVFVLTVLSTYPTMFLLSKVPILRSMLK